MTASDRRYTESHEWISVDGDIATIGITPFAAHELTDITFVEMKPAGTAVNAGESLGEVESVKTTSDVYSPVGGTIVEVNTAATDDPSLVNSDAYDAGWLVRIQTSESSVLDGLLDQATYEAKYPLD